MKLGIVIILIGVAWCARCYLLRPQLPEPPVAGVQIFGNRIVKDFPDDERLWVVTTREPQEGETINWTYWSALENNNRHSHAYRTMTFTNGEWVETERYPKRVDGGEIFR